jgi:ATP-dependent RNA helicase RhlE
MHSERSQGQRREALEGFKAGKYRVLVATDIASRGIDVLGIELVINFDIPENPEDYIHRIGRTARAGAAGRAISFVTPDQKRAVQDIERLLKTFIVASKLPELPQRKFHAPMLQKRNDFREHRSLKKRSRRRGQVRFHR